jgi:hypothetical protein
LNPSYSDHSFWRTVRLKISLKISFQYLSLPCLPHRSRPRSSTSRPSTVPERQRESSRFRRTLLTRRQTPPPPYRPHLRPACLPVASLPTRTWAVA